MGRTPLDTPPPATPRWVKLSAIFAAVLLLLLILHLVVMRGLLGYGPTAHM